LAGGRLCSAGMEGGTAEIFPVMMRVVLAFALACLGGGASALLGLSHQRLCGLISLAAGTLLGVTFFAIIPEAGAQMRVWELLVALGSGYLVFALISRYVYHVCPACAASHFDESTTHHFSEIAGALVVALAVHSTMDGVALAIGHEASQHLDATMLMAVSVHKVPEGLALGALLMGAGFSRARAVVWVAVVETTTLLGGVLGLLVLPWLSGIQHSFWIWALLAHAGGGFLYLAGHAVLGEMVKHGRARVLSLFAVGVLVIAVVHGLVHLVE
jgi:zinc transporter ZupT